MKRKIDKIKGKRLVMGGGTNLLTKDEILVTETPNGVELKERSSDGSIKEIASGGGGGDNEELKLKYIYIKVQFNDENLSNLFSMFDFVVPALVRTNYEYAYGIFTQEIPFNDAGVGFLEQNYFNCKILDTIYKIYNKDGSVGFEGNFIELCTTLALYVPNIITEEEYLNNI